MLDLEHRDNLLVKLAVLQAAVSLCDCHYSKPAGLIVSILSKVWQQHLGLSLFMLIFWLSEQ